MSEQDHTYRTRQKSINRLLLAFSNASRGLFISLFGLVLNYILLNYKPASVLNLYVYCISIVNLLLVFSNWGGKDYSVKLLSASQDKLRTVVNALINSRILFFPLLVLVLLFVPVNNNFKIFIAIYTLFKTINSVFEALITIQKQFHAFLFIELFLTVAFIFSLLVDGSRSATVFLIELATLELLKLVVNAIFFRKLLRFRFSFKEGLRTVLHSRDFFYVCLAGFICARADLYSVGLLLDKEQMSTYFIILNLAGLCQVTYATLVNTFSSTIFRYNAAGFKKFSALLFKTGLAFSAIAAIGVYILASWYYHIVLSPYFAVLIFFNIFIFSIVLIELYHFTRQNRQDFILKALILSGTANILLSLVLCNYFGLPGAFLSNTLGLLITLICFKIYTACTHARN